METITKLGLSLIFAVIILNIIIFALLPIYPMPASLTSAIDWLFTSLWAFNFMLPVGAMLTIFGISLFLHFLFVSIKFVLFLFRLFSRSAGS